MTCTREKSSILACMALASSDKEGGGRAVDERLTRLVWSLRSKIEWWWYMQRSARWDIIVMQTIPVLFVPSSSSGRILRSYLYPLYLNG